MGEVSLQISRLGEALMLLLPSYLSSLGMRILVASEVMRLEMLLSSFVTFDVVVI